jgi:hypothetical protein
LSSCVDDSLSSSILVCFTLQRTQRDFNFFHILPPLLKIEDYFSKCLFCDEKFIN